MRPGDKTIHHFFATIGYWPEQGPIKIECTVNRCPGPSTSWTLEEISNYWTLSLCGEIGRNSFGQINDTLRENFDCINWYLTRAHAEQLLDIWDQWHLNDMSAGCKHQIRDGWKNKKVDIVKVTDRTWKLYGKAAEDKKLAHNMLTRARNAAMRGKEYKPRSPRTQALMQLGIIKIATERKNACQVWESEHPDGLLTKPCPTCGYKYGSQWLVRPLPGPIWRSLKTALSDVYNFGDEPHPARTVKHHRTRKYPEPQPDASLIKKFGRTKNFFPYRKTATPHPFVIGNKHIAYSQGATLNPRVAPCDHCGRDYDEHKPVLVIHCRVNPNEDPAAKNELEKYIKGAQSALEAEKYEGIAFHLDTGRIGQEGGHNDISAH